MQSQPEILEPPSCEDGHGMMVPMDVDFVWFDDDGLVKAIVAWVDRDDKMKAYIYAPTADDMRAVHPVGPGLGEWIYAQQQSGRMGEYYDTDQTGVFRIDDSRAGHNYTYKVFVGEPTEDTVLRPQTVYRFFDDESHGYPPLTDFDAVVGLMSDPSAVVITDTSGVVNMTTEDAAPIKGWDLKNRVVVWDEAAIVSHSNRNNN